MAQTQTNPIRDFFAQYPDFDYDPNAPFFDEFKRMPGVLHWSQDERGAAREALRSAMVRQFNDMYGTNVDDLESWHLLCTALGMTPPPDDIKTCQRKIKATHVNIVDFIEAPLSGASIVTFKSELALSKYTKQTTKYFPRDDVNSGSLLRYLLRRIMNPPADPVKVHPIRDFFAKYPNFELNPQAPFFEEFKRMITNLNWTEKQRDAARNELRKAMVKQFNAIYGTDVKALESWQLLCSALGMKPVPKNIEACRRVRGYDLELELIEAPLLGKSVGTFDSEVELSKYTKTLKKYFPPVGNLSRHLLRRIWNPKPRHSVAELAQKAEGNVLPAQWR
ncbi:hypothetical protein TRAPUB_9897 [Trametes pubescens]|uniref:Uncharacterized protein n=1 Tax=Trametes pubescens TaxID=154538 RepID=A0A1M2W172_TRAPU|nr:hypothetical protein TRAPUB_9897 [Trametes pubescens]